MDSKGRIRNIMHERNISEYRLAKLSGLSQSTISNIFVRNTAPTIPTIEAICAGLGITLAQFFQTPMMKHPYIFLSSNANCLKIGYHSAQSKSE